MPKRIVVLADPGQSDASNSEAARNGDWPKVNNYQLPAKYVDAPNPGRVCFWPKIQFTTVSPSNAHVASPEVYSIAEFPRSDELFRDTQLLIVNWDAANGDPLYQADATLTYLSTRGQVPLKRFLNDGGVLLVESQTAQSRPVQESYDAIFDSREVTVGSVPRDEFAAGTEAHVLRGARKHPIVQFSDSSTLKFDSNVSTTEYIFVNVPTEVAAPVSQAGPRGSNGSISRKLWFGWFTQWSVDWMPLLYIQVGQDDRYPVLLSKVHGRGLILLSTLWLSVAQHPLCSRIAEVALSSELLTESVRVQKRKVFNRRLVDSLIGLVFTLAIFLTAFGVVELARNAEQNWILATLGIGVIGLITAAWKIFLRVYDRPLGVSFIKTFGPRDRLVGKRR